MALTLSTAYFVSDSCNTDKKYIGFSSFGYDCSAAKFGAFDFAFLFSSPFDPIFLSPIIIGTVFMILQLRSQRNPGWQHLRFLRVISVAAGLVSILVLIGSYGGFGANAEYLNKQCHNGNEQTTDCLDAAESHKAGLFRYSIQTALGALMLASVSGYLGKLPKAQKISS